MTALGIDMSSREADLFYWPAPSTHGKSPEYLAVSDKIEELWVRYLRLCDDEIVDEINRLEKQKEYLWKRDQQELAMLIEKQKKNKTAASDKTAVLPEQIFSYSKRSIS